MKIAIDARIIYTTTGRYVERLIHHLQQIDHENQYVVMLLQKDFDRWQSAAPNFTKVVADYPPYSLREQFQFASQLRGLKVDLVHFTMPQQPVFYFGRKITTVHDLTLLDFVNKRRLGFLKDIYKNQLKPALFKFVMWSVVRSSYRVIAPTKYVRNELITRFGLSEERVVLTYESAEITAVEPDLYKPAEGKKYLMYVGNAFPYKNLKQSIKALQLMDRPDLYLVFVGKHDFFYEELVKYVDDNQIKNVIFTGFVSDEELAWLYQHALLYVFASLSEGFGLPPLEAMLYGLPVASSNATCLPEVYGDAAEYFDPKDAGNIATVLSGLIDNPKRRKELSQKGYEQVAKYSWKKMAEETLAIYNDKA
jgi:glycosyltransferase involved in cell wall biosynthesis